MNQFGYGKYEGSSTFILFLSCLNIWPYLLIRSSARRKIIQKPGDIFNSTGFVLACLDLIVLLIFNCSYYINLTNRELAVKHLIVTIIFCGAVLLLSAVVILVASLTECGTHDPTFNSNLYILSIRNEEASRREKPLAVIYSSSFRISIQNVGNKPFGGEVILERRVEWTKSTSNRTGTITSISYDDIFCYRMRLHPPLQPGKILHFIPETHEMPGACKIPGYRSFGKFKRDSVKTTIFYGDLLHYKVAFSSTDFVRLIEYFELKDQLEQHVGSSFAERRF